MKTVKNIILSFLLSLFFGQAVGFAMGAPVIGHIVTIVAFSATWIPGPEGSLSTVCSLISAGLSPDCDNPLIAGVNDRLILINKSEISSISYNVTNTEIIESITLASGKTGFVYQGQNFSNEPSSRAIVGRYAKRIEHQVDFLVFGEGGAVKKQLNLMMQAKLCAIVQNQFEASDGSAAFTFYGVQQGLQIAEMEQLKSDQETLGAYRVSLKSYDQALEAKLPNAIFITDFSTTKTMIDGLL